jgi:4-amino-4-deoxy-L-arabinose transferase-like glycosyltransferase
MVIKRSVFFLILALLITVPLLVGKIIWLSKTKTTTGVMSFEGLGNAGDMLRSTYSVFYFEHDDDTTWFNSSANISYKPGDLVSVRYNSSNPDDARLNTFPSIWLGTLLAGGIPLLIMLVIFINRHIVPHNNDIRLSKRKPYLFLQSRSSGNYDSL